MSFFSTCSASLKRKIIGIPSYNTQTHQIGLLLGGQSNMQGSHFDTAPSYLQEPLGGVYILKSGVWEILDYPTNQQSSTSTSFACELSLGYELQAHYGSDIYISKYAVSSAPIYNDSGRTDFNINTDEAYLGLRDAGIDLKSKIESLGKIPIIVFVWIQGEGDRATDDSANNYKTNFNEIYQGLQTEGVGVNYTILNLLKTAASKGEPSITRGAIIKQLQADWCNESGNRFGLDMAPYPFRSDDNHFTGSSQVLIGEDIKSIIVNQILN